jgi:hypothetical protein
MDLNEGMDHLRSLYKDKEWFHSVGQDQYGRIVVYIHHATHETLHDIPDRVANKQVLVHFAGSLCLNKDQYSTTLTSRTPVEIPDNFIATFKRAVQDAQAKGFDTGLLSTMDDETNEVFEDLSQRRLENELTRLEKTCGSNTLQDIFYEIRDANNAVTNLSARYPDIRKALEKLYDQYGFDVIYENLDG